MIRTRNVETEPGNWMGCRRPCSYCTFGGVLAHHSKDGKTIAVEALSIAPLLGTAYAGTWMSSGSTKPRASGDSQFKPCLMSMQALVEVTLAQTLIIWGRHTIVDRDATRRSGCLYHGGFDPDWRWLIGGWDGIRVIEG